MVLPAVLFSKYLLSSKDYTKLVPLNIAPISKTDSTNVSVTFKHLVYLLTSLPH